jgi:arylamine N-acetyltransferase
MVNDAKLRDQSLIEAYRELLIAVDASELTLATLRLLTERHLQYIPFESFYAFRSH